MIGLAQRLSASGLDVTLYLTASGDSPEDLTRLTHHFAEMHDIKVERYEPARDNIHRYEGMESRSLGIYDYFKRSDFDVVYFPLEGGLAYYSLLAKETGLSTLRSQLVVIAHSPLEWASQADRFFFRRVDEAKAAFMEKYCAGQADSLICTNAALLDWFKDHGWNLTKATTVLPALAPQEWRPDNPSANAAVLGKRELVLIAGSRYRDGVTLFCDALDELAKSEAADLDVTIVGGFGKILGEHSGGLFVRRARHWPFRLHMKPRTTLLEGIRQTAVTGGVAIIPSLASATGFFVSECLHLGARFVATSVGGNLGQLRSDQEKALLAPPNAKELAARIKHVLASTDRLTTRIDEHEKVSLWLIHHEKCTKQLATAGRKPVRHKAPLVSVIIAHHDRPQYLMQLVASLEEQDYRNFEVILVDDGSKLPESHATLDRLEEPFVKKDWKIIRGENRYVGAARNRGVKESRGGYIIFIDDDNALFPHAISTFVHAIEHSRSDVCTALAKTFYDVHVPSAPDDAYVSYVPLGGSLDMGFLTNCFGDTISIYRRSIFDTIGYQFEKFGYMVEDHEFFVRILLAGLKMRLIPECLFWYRVSTRGRYRSSHYYDNQIPIIDAYRRHGYKGLDHLYNLFLGQNIGQWQAESFRSNLYYSPSDHDYLRLCDLEPNSQEALQLLAEIAASEARPETAIGLLAAGRFAGFADLTKQALIADQHANGLLELSPTLMTTRVVKECDLKLALVTSSPPVSQRPVSAIEKDGTLVLEAKGESVCLAVLPALCPTSTVSAVTNITFLEGNAAAAEFMLMLCPMHDDPVISVLAAGRDPNEGSSGWTAVPRSQAPLAIEAKLAAPSQRPMNLVLAVRAAGGQSRTVLTSFTKTAVRISAQDQVMRRPPNRAASQSQRARAWTDAQRRSARLATAYPSTLPLLLLPNEVDEGIFLRPSEAGPVVATLERAFPAFGRSVIARVEICHDEAGPFEFAVAACLPGTEGQWQNSGPRNALAFSGWVTVSERFTMQDIVAKLPEKVPEALSIALAVRLPRRSKAAPANAFFRKLVFCWDD
ncbi:glycosyltransferase [Nordella sp. HKS 07]|uniref:DUF6212 domain-containing protein n=1 Tax=Nordella sp. HKS 07 TaxID=2712222 RepID=UPI0013E1B181|nr:DUF6212 domain-containing protein [Nordella sp. HKS 07]QIG52183.1 glycosyltransferase [Nordella sp. HKS 07]